MSNKKVVKQGKYILLTCTDHINEEPLYFDTLELAHAKMEEQLLEQIEDYADWTVDEYYDIGSTYAWANTHGTYSDWTILPPQE
jgi:hypothetical protein